MKNKLLDVLHIFGRFYKVSQEMSREISRQIFPDSVLYLPWNVPLLVHEDSGKYVGNTWVGKT